VIKKYLAERDVTLKSAHEEESRQYSSKRKKEISSKQATAKASLPVQSQRKYHPDLFIGLRQRGAKQVLTTAVVALLARTYVCWLNMGSIPYIIAPAYTGNVKATFRGLAYNIGLGLINWFLDRLYEWRCNDLELIVLEGWATKIHSLLVQRNAMHYASTLGILEHIGVRAGEVTNFTDELREFCDKTVKTGCMATLGFFLTLRTHGWVGLLFMWASIPLHFLVNKFLMPDYIRYTQQVADLDGKYKTAHARFRQHIEPIAFSGGGRAEQAIIEHRFDQLQKLQAELNRRELLFQAVNYFLIQADNLPQILTRTLSMHWTVRYGGGAIRSGQDLINTMCLSRSTSCVFNNIPALLNIPVSISKLLGHAQRNSELAFGLEEAAAKAPSVAEPSVLPAGSEPCICVQNLDVVTPKSGDPLAVGVDFNVDKASALVVTGPNGSGKSLLSAYIAGLRPLCGERPSVSVCGLSVGAQKPHMRDLFRIPQRPYLVVGGLGDNVAYPLPGAAQSAERLQECLDMVGIGYLVKRHGGLESEPELPWDEILSGGEQQRIGIARSLFHRPVFVILDDCTSMVSQEAELDLYRIINQGGTIPITISQRLTLPEMHSHELKLGCGTLEGWKLSKVET